MLVLKSILKKKKFSSFTTIKVLNIFIYFSL